MCEIENGNDILTANFSSNPPLTTNAMPANTPPVTILCKSVRHKWSFAKIYGYGYQSVSCSHTNRPPTVIYIEQLTE